MTVDWVSVFFGALLGYALPYFFNSIVYVFRHFRKERFEGDWYLYHLTLDDNSPVLVEASWKIKKGFDAKYSVEEYRKNGSKLENLYSGQLIFERNFWLFKLRHKKAQEEVLLRFKNPMPPYDKATTGLYLGTDLPNGYPVAGPILMSKKQFNREKAIEQLKKNTSIERKTGRLKLK